VELLLRRGADPVLETADGSNALTLAMNGVPDIDRFTWGKSQCDVVRLLLRAAPELQSRENLFGRVTRRLVGRTGCVI
jgi:hypothetical protein